MFYKKRNYNNKKNKLLVLLANGRYKEEEEFSFNRIGFPIKYRPQELQKDLVEIIPILKKVINDLLTKYPSIIRLLIYIEEEIKLYRRLITIQRNIFINNIFDVPKTNLIVYYIPTYTQARAINIIIPLFIYKKKEFQQKKFLELIKARIFTYIQLLQIVRTRFPRKANNSKLRIIYLYCLVNKATIKDSYPLQRIEPIRNRLVQRGYSIYF